MTQLELVHGLPGRWRLRFRPPLPMHLAFGLQDRITGLWPHIPCRVWGLGQGLVIGDGVQPLAADLLDQLRALLNEPIDHQPTWRDGVISGLMVLAILGWALPVLPGTPFFLMAIALRASRR